MEKNSAPLELQDHAGEKYLLSWFHCLYPVRTPDDTVQCLPLPMFHLPPQQRTGFDQEEVNLCHL